MSPWKGKIVKGAGTWEYVITNDSIYSKPLCHKDHMFRGQCNYQVNEEDVVAWGYEGAGPRQLAFAILCHGCYHHHCGGSWNVMAKKYSKAFMEDVVSKWGDKWKITLKEIIEWIKEQEANETRPGQS